MWRHIAAVILLPSLAVAQGAQSQPNPMQRGTATLSPKPLPLSYQPYAYYNAIRRGRAEQVALKFYPNAFVVTPTQPASGIVPLNLDLEPEQGFTLLKLRYPKARSQRVQFQSTPILFARDHWIRFELHAASSVSLGTHVLKGKLTFQPVDPKSGAGPVRQVDVEIPVNVVDHDAKVKRTGWPFHMPTPLLVMLIIVLVPVAIATAPLWLICAPMGLCGD
jgi:hypothetical protein